MNLGNRFINYLSFGLIFFLIIITVSSTEFSSRLIHNSLHNLYPQPSINIKNQEPWQRDLYFNRIKDFEQNPIGNNKIVFLGNSITAGGGDWNKKLNANNIVNRGISGDYTEGILTRLKEIIFYKPVAVFLMIGVNEFFKDNTNTPEITPTYVANNIFKIAEKIKKGSPGTLIFIETILPINNQHYIDVKKVDYNFLQPNYKPSINDQINEVNSILKKHRKYTVLDLHHFFLNDLDVLDPTFSSDGVHLNQNGYQILTDKICHLIARLNSNKK